MLDSIDHRLLLQDDRDTVARFVAGLERLALRIARAHYRFRPDEAEEILLEVVRKLWDGDKAALRAWRGEGSLESWLTAIVHRFCLMELRRRKRRSAEVATDRLDEFEAEALPEPFEREELRRLYRVAATELSERDRRLLQLRFEEERDYPAITAELGLSYGAARKALHSAIRRLREKMREIAPELFRSGVRS